jgi:hypothetical protein
VKAFLRREKSECDRPALDYLVDWHGWLVGGER